MFERLPTPWGLVRLGVAPDHPKIKEVSRAFGRIAPQPETPARTVNMALGVVREVIYLGSLRKHVVSLPGGVSVTSCSQVGQDRGEFPPGTRVCVSWNAEDSILIPADS